jgi:hypothetical protein
MSTASRLGYDGEKPVLDFYLNHDQELLDSYANQDWRGGREMNYYRPRAGHRDDCGDIAGLPYVVSCKNYASARPADWVSGLKTMCVNANLPTGIVVWKRRGKASPADWYVFSTLGLFMPFHDAYLMAELSA